MSEHKLDDLPRRPNPPNWVPPAPGSAYNPYDPHDLRPPQGYPSEFNTPGKASSMNSLPGEASSYQKMRRSMKLFGYEDPRPYSDKYPGQRKVLKRVYNYDKFYHGVKLTGKCAMGAIVIYSLFIHRWNNGYENIFSETYRWKLRAKYLLFGELTEQEKEDLAKVKFKPDTHKVLNPNHNTLNPEDYESPDLALERPQAKHFVEAERLLAEREQKVLKALDLAETQMVISDSDKALQGSPFNQGPSSGSRWIWKFW